MLLLHSSKHITFYSVTKTAAQNISVEKIEKRPAWKPGSQAFKRRPAHQWVLVRQVLWIEWFKFLVDLVLRLLARISVLPREPVVNSLEILIDQVVR